MAHHDEDLRVVRLPYWSRWEMRPVDAGQMVERCFCTDGDYLYERALDRSEHSTRFYRKELADDVDLEAEMDVPNGVLPPTQGKWEEIIAVQGDD
jgi:hypothetical protein